MKLKQFFLVFISFIVLSFGYLRGSNMSIEKLFSSLSAVQMAVTVLIAFYTSYIHIILHEWGHLLFGKLTGYTLVFFEISNIRYDAINKKIKRMPVSQSILKSRCVMRAPLTKKDVQKPYFLYLAGGLLVNLITAMVFFAGSFFFQGLWGFSAFILSLPPFLLFVWKLFDEGYLIKEISQSKQAKKVYIMELNLEALIEAGELFEDLPDSYFDEIENSLFTKSRLGEYLLLIACQRQLSFLNFEGAEKLINQYDLHWNYLESPHADKLTSLKLFLHALFGRHYIAEKLFKEISQTRELKVYYGESPVVQAAYSFFTKVDIEETKRLLKKVGMPSQINGNQAEMKLQEKLSEWLRNYFY